MGLEPLPALLPVLYKRRRDHPPEFSGHPLRDIGGVAGSAGIWPVPTLAVSICGDHAERGLSSLAGSCPQGPALRLIGEEARAWRASEMH